MKYITQDYIEIKPNVLGVTIIKIVGTDEWNIIVGLGGLVNVKNQANKIIENYINKLDKED